MTASIASCHSTAKTDAGFTLLEMLVALALLALMLAAMPGALRLGVRALSVAGDLERGAARQAAMDFIEQRLVQASPIFEHRADGRARIAFRGAATSVAFVAPAASGAMGGLYRFELKNTIDAVGRNGIIATYALYRPGADDPDDKVQRPERLLMPDTAIAIRYFGAATPRGEAQWNDAWETEENLPELVEVSFTAVPGEARRVMLVPLRLRPVP